MTKTSRLEEQFLFRPDLTFAISSQGTHSHLQRLLLSLQGQRASDLNFEVLVGSAVDLNFGQDPFRESAAGLRIKPVKVRAGNLSVLRNKLYAEASGRMVYFLDEDCALPEDFVFSLRHLLTGDESKAYGGYYNSPPGSMAQRQAYNSLANLWLKTHESSPQPLALAGNVLMPKLKNSPPTFPFLLSQHFGGEEIGFCENLHRHGIRIFHREHLGVWHHCEHSLVRFFSRARLHGKSAYRPSRGKISAAAIWAHLRLERGPYVLFLIFCYMITVRTSRAWTSLWESSYAQYGDPQTPEFSASLDSHSRL